VENFGSPKNFDCGILENRLIHVGKHNSKFTQKRGPSVFTKQLGDRIHEQQCIDKANRCLGISQEDDVSSSSNEQRSHTDTHFQKSKPCYNIYRVGNNTFCNWLTKKRTVVPEVVVEFIGEIMETEGLESLNMFTEIIHKKKTYRAHPNYRNDGPWYDWAMVRYEPSHEDLERAERNLEHQIESAYPPGYYPAKLLGYFMLNENLHCVIHCTETKISSVNDSCLTERWNLEYNTHQRRNRDMRTTPLFRHCEVECIEDRVFVVEESPGVWADLQNMSSSVVMVKHKSKWKDYFTDTT
jgi:hypothetical protein